MAQTPRPQPSLSPTPVPTETPEPTATPAPTPAFAPLEIVFMQRVSDGGPIHLFSHDFAGSATPEPLARDNRGVEHYAWAPNGKRGVALVVGNPLELNPGNSAIDLGDGFDGIAIAQDSTTAWAVRATLAGSNDRAELLQVNLDSGAVQSIATWTYPHPTTFQENAIKEAAFADDGGLNRVSRPRGRTGRGLGPGRARDLHLGSVDRHLGDARPGAGPVVAQRRAAGADHGVGLQLQPRP